MDSSYSRETARYITLCGSVLIALCSGTNYGFSAYGPQLGARLHITHTQLNLVALAGNLGVYTSGPFWGKVVDSRGPFILFVCALALLFSGYFGIRSFYNGWFDFLSPDGFSTFAMFLLILFSICTGLGGNSGFTAAVNATAKSFPDASRGTTTALVLSGFGLSAFLFSTIAHVFFPGDASSFLLLLALGTALPMLVGVFFVRPIPFAPVASSTEPAGERLLGGDDTQDDDDNEHHDNIYTPITVGHVFENVEEEESNTPLLASEVSSLAESELDRISMHSGSGSSMVTAKPNVPRSRSPSPAPNPQLLSDTVPHSESRRTRSRTMSKVRAHGAGEHGDVYGTALFRKSEFWILFAIMSLLSGTGLMWINNVGSIAQALYAHANPETFPTDAGDEASSKLQAAQVSFTSIGNCAGRIIIGVVADIGRNRFGISRPTFLACVAAFFIMSQLFAAGVTDPDQLWVASLLVGMSYGGMFGLCPVIVIEWFGLGHFSQNWGFASWSPLFGGNIFSLAFGRNLDAHAPHPELNPPPAPSSTTPAPAPTAVIDHAIRALTSIGKFLARAGGIGVGPKPDASHQCMEGNLCYVDSLYMTAGACTVALALSIWATVRDRKKRLARERRRQSHISAT